MKLIEVNCPVCESESSDALFNVRDYTRHISEDHYGVRRCHRCGCGFLSPRPAENQMGRFYDQAFYWSHEGSAVPLSPEQVLELRRPQLEAKAHCVSDMAPGRLLDIGAQKGEFLWYMAQRGWRTEGVELSNTVPNSFQQDIRYGDFLEMELPRAAYDCITMWAVLEHVYQPKPYLEKVLRLLKPGGRLVALVTNFDSIQGRFFRADDYPRHLTFFTRRSLARLIRDAEMDVIRIWTDQQIFGGALNGGLVLLAKLIGGYSTDELFSEWRQDRDPELFYCKWRGQRSSVVRQISRVDRALTLLPEKILDRVGRGFILLVTAEKRKGAHS